MGTRSELLANLRETWRQTWRARLRAVAIHLAICAAVFGVALYLILVHWYPGFHFTVDGGWQGVRIMALVDLVLGPLLTLIIFNPLKPRRAILFDFGCIGVIQAGALAWGFYAVHWQHPVSLNFDQGDFASMTVQPLRTMDTPLSVVRRLSDRRPALIYVVPPRDDDEMSRAVAYELSGPIAPHEDPLRFARFDEHWAEVKAYAKGPFKWGGSREQIQRELDALLAARGGTVDDYAFFPYLGRYGRCLLVFTAGGELAGAVGCQEY